MVENKQDFLKIQKAQNTVVVLHWEWACVQSLTAKSPEATMEGM